MKYEREVQFKCDNCKRSVTDKKHVRILLSSDSGWMEPPFIGGEAVVKIRDRKPEFHFCKPECLAAFFITTLNEIRTDTGRNERADSKSPARRVLSKTTSTARSRMPGENNLGARDIVQGQASERDMGNSLSLRTYSSGVRYGKDYQRMDSDQPYDQEGRVEVPEIRLETKKGISQLFVRAITFTKKLVW